MSIIERIEQATTLAECRELMAIVTDLYDDHVLVMLSRKIVSLAK